MKTKIQQGDGDLTSGAVWKAILAFASPLLVGNLLQQLYNLTDSVIVGYFLGKEALAAVSASFFIYYFIISLMIGIGSGITVVVSHHCGARQYTQVQRAFSSFFIFAWWAGIALSCAGMIFAEAFFRLTGTPEEVMPCAVSYFRTYIGGTFLFVIFNSMLSILRGMGDSTRPMLFVLATAVLNVALDLLFIAVLKQGVEGAAFATILAQGGGLAIALAYVHRRHPLLSLRRKDMIFDRKMFVRGLKIGLPTSVQQCAMAAGLMALLGTVNSFGTDTLTAYGAAGKIDTLVTQAILTFAGALAAFCGQNIGAQRLDRVRSGVRFAIRMNLAFCSVTFGLILFFGKDMMRMFTTDRAVIDIGYEYLLATGSFLVVNGMLNILTGALRGAGDTVFAMITGIATFWLARIPLAFFLSNVWGRNGIWWAINISIALGFIATGIYYKTERWKKRQVTDRMTE
ncbi:MAG: MATE family efflux transporter [Tannerella sp.]|nr:MATE family efflux transporter [Tannerella sp.]